MPDIQWQIQQTADTDLPESDIRAVANRAGASAFSVHITGPMTTVLGSGFAVANGVVTAKHVLAPILVPGTGDTVPGSVISIRRLSDLEYSATRTQFVARDYDLAVLAPPANVTPLQWGDSSAMRQREKVVVLAAPDTLGDTFVAYAAAGVILDLATVVPDLFRYSIPVQPGSSGGPVLVLDAGGRVVGINLLQERQGDRVVGVGLKSNLIRAVLAGDVVDPSHPPVLLPEGVTGTDALILGGATGLALYMLRAILG